MPEDDDLQAVASGLPGAGRVQRILRLTVPLVLIAILVAVLASVDGARINLAVTRLQGTWIGVAIPALIIGGAGLIALGVPGTLVSMAAGAGFGFGLGLPVAWATALLAACLSVAAGRILAGGDRPAAPGRRARLRRALGAADWRLIALLRLCPVLPYAALNVILGSCRVAWTPLLAGTALGLVPGTAVHVYLAAAGRRLALGGSLAPLEWGLLAVGLASIPVTAWWFGGILRRRM